MLLPKASVITALLRPLPFAEQEQLVMLWKRDKTAGRPFVKLAMAEVRDWRQQSHFSPTLGLSLPTAVKNVAR
jgi:hypothetical protein